MFISDLFKILGDRLNGRPCRIPELEFFFQPAFAADLPDLGSAYLTAASSFIFNQLTIWDRVVIWLEQREVAEFILRRNGALSSAALASSTVIDAVRLPVVDGKICIEAKPIDDGQAFNITPAPGAYLVYILSGTVEAEMALRVAAAQTDIRFPVAVMLKAPLEDLEGFVDRLKSIDHMVAGWLNVPEADGRVSVIALVTIGAGYNEI